jgi:hypothetical protein
LHDLLVAGLQVLTVEGNKDVTDVSMPTVALLMQRLKSLDLRHTGVTANGRGWLQRGLTGLCTLRLCGHSSADAEALQKVWPAVVVYCDDRCPKDHARSGS